MLTITSAERRALRGRAHHLHPVVAIGQHGLTPSVLREIDVNLRAHELIKVRAFSDIRGERDAMLGQICAKLGAAPVQHIGKLLIIYRPKPEAGAERSGTSGRGMREVTIVKPSASGTKRPSVTKVMVKGNERVTAGGSIKRAKPRQKSVKKSALGK